MFRGKNSWLYWALAVAVGVAVGEFLKPIDRVMDMLQGVRK